MSDELASELAFDRLAAQMCTGPAPARVREVIRRAESFPALAPRVRAEVQAQVLGWLEHLGAVPAARRAAPTRAAYRPLRRALEVAASEAFGAPWRQLAAWSAGVPGSAPKDSPSDSFIDLSKNSPSDSLNDLSNASSTGSSKDLSNGSSKDLSNGSSKDLPEGVSRDVWLPATADSLEAWLGLLWPAEARSVLAISRSAQRPRTWRRGATLLLEVRAAPNTAQGAFDLAHELGHAAAALVHPLPLPRAIDEAVAALVARQLEHAADGPVHRALRARRYELACRLARIEDDAELLDELAPGPALPWALWHDAGAQRAYLHAEALASTWWDQGLRWGPPWPAARAALAAAVTHAVAEARALPAPWR